MLVTCVAFCWLLMGVSDEGINGGNLGNKGDIDWTILKLRVNTINTRTRGTKNGKISH